MCKKTNASKIGMFLLVLWVCASLPAVSAHLLFYYKGPDFSPDQMFMLTDFRVEGPVNPKVGDAITVTFTFTCQTGGTLGPKGIFAAARDPDGTNRDFGTTRTGETLKPNDVITLSSSVTVDEAGVWKIWPSYQIKTSGQPMTFGPDYWHSANISIAAFLRPDLIVTEIVGDANNSRVGFTVANQGNATAASSFAVRLLVGGQSYFETVPQGLAPGANHTSWFAGYVWPENTNITVTVTADFYNAVAELNEGNNELTKDLSRPVEPLRITQGPAVAVVDSDTAVITWQTNLNSNSSVTYGTTMIPGSTCGNSTPTKNHYVALDGLLPGATYSFYVESWDDIGQRAISKQLTFEMPPEHDAQPPSLYVPPWNANLSGIIDVEPQADDDGGIDRLLFYFDGVLTFTDYSPPFRWQLNTTDYPDGPHNITVVAIDRLGNKISRSLGVGIDNPGGDSRAPVVSITSPVEGETVWGSVRIEALALDVGIYGEETGHIQEAQLIIDGALARSWAYTPFRFNPMTGEVETFPPNSSMQMTHFWDTSGLLPGSNHTIAVRAWDNSGNMGSAVRNISIVKLEAAAPSLEILMPMVEFSRSVVRHSNWFEVTLSITNVGNVNLSGFQLTEKCDGFQMIPLPMPSTSADRSRYVAPEKACYMDFADDAGLLKVGGTWTVSYYAVPILYEPAERFYDPMYQIGSWTYLTANSHSYHEEYVAPYLPALRDENHNGISELREALNSSDYLIITNPGRLFASDPSDREGVDLLLADAATLAKAKNGILGYLTSVNASTELKPLISPGGAWANRLFRCFQDPTALNAFLLIIGKAEIVPSHTYDISGWGISWSNDGSTKRCPLSDNYYADTVGNDGRPDLIVGRIIGNTARLLLMPIEASLEVHMGHGITRDQALAVSGCEESSSDLFVESADKIGHDLASQGFNCETVHYSNLIENAWTVHFDEGDLFALADVDGDGIDEAIIGRDEEDAVYIYECCPRSLLRSFACPLTVNDGLTAGDYDGDGKAEIAIAHNGDGQEGRLYIYEANGTLVGSWDVPFSDWDLIGSGDLYRNYGESSPSDEIVIASCEYNTVKAYRLYFDSILWGYRLDWQSFSLGIDLKHYDAMAVGNLRGDLDLDEVAIAKEDNSRIYVYDVFGTYGIDGVNRRELSDLDGKSGNDVRYTKYDGFAAGDVDNDGEDELVILCDEDDKIYLYRWEEHWTVWSWTSIYSRFWDYWFNGVYYTGGSGRHDGFGIGRFNLTEPERMVVLLNEFGDMSSFQSFVADDIEAEKFANRRINSQAPYVSIMTICGHGNCYGASPVWTCYAKHYDLANHPLVIAIACSAGDYIGIGFESFGDVILSRGAGAYIGSTRESARSANVDFMRGFFQSCWDIGSEPPALALRDWKRSHFDDKYHRLWVYEYNFYGDPKFWEW
uniref:Fibronectin type-III domain-containing protein n=1 Tax=Candidatus Methanomethylicus mesodigestus TaxID=1867258 RepID=A0A7C3J3E0_9CREN